MGWSYEQLMALPDDYLDVLSKWIIDRTREARRLAKANAR